MVPHKRATADAASDTTEESRQMTTRPMVANTRTCRSGLTRAAENATGDGGPCSSSMMCHLECRGLSHYHACRGRERRSGKAQSQSAGIRGFRWAATQSTNRRAPAEPGWTCTAGASGCGSSPKRRSAQFEAGSEGLHRLRGRRSPGFAQHVGIVRLLRLREIRRDRAVTAERASPTDRRRHSPPSDLRDGR